ncbi:MAG: apolipoprotein N-acyltransferase [Candidatus Omnitrophota bacterium]|jgi:apolipoprotein N-acyltransferase
MRLRLYRKEIILIVLYVAAQSFIFHSPKLAPLAFLSLIPLLFCIESCASRREAVIFGYIAGVLQTALTYYWILHVTKFGFLALCVYLGVYTAIFSVLAFRQVKILALAGSDGHGFAWIKIFTLASIWTIIEFFRSSIPIMKFPWALFSYSQWKNLIFIQSADMIGPYGVSFILAIANMALFAFVILFIRVLRDQVPTANGTRSRTSRRSLLANAMALLMFGAGIPMLNMTYGDMALKQVRTGLVEGKQYRVSLIQGNIPQEEKWNDRIKNIIFDKYNSLSRQVIMDKPDLVIWPETSFPGYWEDEPAMAQKVFKLARDLRAYFLIGAPTLKAGEGFWHRMNSALFISRNGGEITRHHKIRLVPFGEYIPFFKFVRKFFDDIGHFTPGELMTVIELPSDIGKVMGTQTLESFRPKFSVLICFEDIFPDLCRRYVNGGSNLLINITNDAWFKKSTGAYQHAQSSVFRAVENRVTVIRAANTGLSCFISPDGKIQETVNKDGEEIMVQGYETFPVTLAPSISTYRQIGDAFIWIVLALWLATMHILSSSIKLTGDRDQVWDD